MKFKVGDKVVNYYYEIGVILEVTDSKYLCQFGNRKDWLEEDNFEVINE
ncbi:hypothetical protein [Providencia vermicola]